MLIFPLGVHILLEGALLQYRTCDKCRKTQKFGFSQAEHLNRPINVLLRCNYNFNSCWTNCLTSPSASLKSNPVKPLSFIQ